MTALVHCGLRTYPNGNGVAIAKFLRAAYNSGDLALAGQGEELGVMEEHMLATDEVGSVRHLKPGDTIRMVAAQAITAGANVYRAAAGKITDAQFGSEDRIGIALEAGSGDGSAIEVLITHAEQLVVSTGTTTTTASP